MILFLKTFWIKDTFYIFWLLCELSMNSIISVHADRSNEEQTLHITLPISLKEAQTNKQF